VGERFLLRPAEAHVGRERVIGGRRSRRDNLDAIGEARVRAVFRRDDAVGDGRAVDGARDVVQAGADPEPDPVCKLFPPPE